MPYRPIPRFALAALTMLLATACLDREPPTATPEIDADGSQSMRVKVSCEADVRNGEVRCGQLAPGGGDRAIIVGGQGVYVQLTSSNIVVAADTFSFDVTVQNLIHQAMGTLDGTTPHADGVRVLFEMMPTATSGSGEVTILNADGLGTFTRANQPYYQYDGILLPDAITDPRQWRLLLDPGVLTFAFSVYVATEVQYTGNWIDLSEGPGNLLEGDTTTLTAVLRSYVGNPVLGVIDWSSSDPAIATVNSSGLVTAEAPGAITITAESGSASSEVAISVCPAMAVGEVYTVSMPAAAEVCFGGGEAGTAEYTYMPLNVSPSTALSLTTTGEGIVGVVGPPSPALLPSYSLSGFGSADAMLDPGHVQRRTEEAIRLAGLMSTPTSQVRSTSRSSGPQYTIVPGVPTVGDFWDLNVGAACGARDDRVGQVVSISDHMIVVADTKNPAGGFTVAQYDSLALEFDTIAYAAVTENFGVPTDIDGNNRVVAFFTRAVNELTPAASTPVTFGFFARRDLFNTGDCLGSNAGEMLYMLVPDPTGDVNGNVLTNSLVRSTSVRTMGHELQHLVNASRRQYVIGTGYEDSSLDEALSGIAEELMFYRTSVGLAPGDNIALSTLTTGPNASRRAAAFNTFANPNFGRLRPWLQRPDTTAALRGDISPATLGSAWGFLRYAADRFGGSQAAFWSSLVDSNLAGVANLESAIGGADANLWLRDFTAAMYADDAVAGVSAEYTNPSWNFRSVYSGLGGFPLLARPLTDGVGLTLSYQSGGGTSYIRFGVPQSGLATITSLSGGALPAGPVELVVVRTQ
jgi:hypothetical protein